MAVFVLEVEQVEATAGEPKQAGGESCTGHKACVVFDGDSSDPCCGVATVIFVHAEDGDRFTDGCKIPIKASLLFVGAHPKELALKTGVACKGHDAVLFLRSQSDSSQLEQSVGVASLRFVGRDILTCQLGHPCASCMSASPVLYFPDDSDNSIRAFPLGQMNMQWRPSTSQIEQALKAIVRAWESGFIRRTGGVLLQRIKEWFERGRHGDGSETRDGTGDTPSPPSGDAPSTGSGDPPSTGSGDPSTGSSDPFEDLFSTPKKIKDPAPAGGADGSNKSNESGGSRKRKLDIDEEESKQDSKEDDSKKQQKTEEFEEELNAEEVEALVDEIVEAAKLLTDHMNKGPTPEPLEGFCGFPGFG